MVSVPKLPRTPPPNKQGDGANPVEAVGYMALGSALSGSSGNGAAATQSAIDSASSNNSATTNTTQNNAALIGSLGSIASVKTSGQTMQSTPNPMFTADIVPSRINSQDVIEGLNQATTQILNSLNIVNSTTTTGFNKLISQIDMQESFLSKMEGYGEDTQIKLNEIYEALSRISYQSSNMQFGNAGASANRTNTGASAGLLGAGALGAGALGTEKTATDNSANNEQQSNPMMDLMSTLGIGAAVSFIGKKVLPKVAASFLGGPVGLGIGAGLIGNDLIEMTTGFNPLGFAADSIGGLFAGQQPSDNSGSSLESNATTTGAPGEILGIQEAGKGYNVVELSDGTVEKRTGARNWRNNNPGNIEYGDFAKKQGAIGTDGRFAIFPTFEMGEKAQETLLFEGKNYKDKTIAQAISRYAPASDNNPTSAYINTVSSAVGVPPNTPLSSLTPDQRKILVKTMHEVEGFKIGKTETLVAGTGNAEKNTTQGAVESDSDASISAEPVISTAPISPEMSISSESVASVGESMISSNENISPNNSMSEGQSQNSDSIPTTNIVDLGKWLQEQGYRVSEQEAFGGTTPGIHKGKGHAEERAIDVNVGTGNVEWEIPEQKVKFDELKTKLEAAGYKVIWGSQGHYNHMHIETPAGGLIPGKGEGNTSQPGNQDAAPSYENTVTSALGEANDPYAMMSQMAGGTNIDQLSRMIPSLTGMVSGEMPKGIPEMMGMMQGIAGMVAGLSKNKEPTTTSSYTDTDPAKPADAIPEVFMKLLNPDSQKGLLKVFGF